MRNFEGTTRRRFLKAALAAGTGLHFVSDYGFAQRLAPTPACGEDAGPTAPQTEGPFFKPRSPRRSNLYESGVRGEFCALSGRVLTRRCRPVAGALVDLWHADANGDYDNSGFRFRGHVFADDEGRYAFRTIVPASYPGRTRHFHVKVQAPNRPVLTTQLYFPGDPGNSRDRLFRPELLMTMERSGEGMAAYFDFVLDIA